MSKPGKMIRLPDARVYVRERGSGPALLLINGLGAHTAMWEPLERTLSGFRIVEFDLPGAGESEVPWKPVSVTRLARLSTDLMDHFGIRRADVLGYSMGGIVAQQLAATEPDRVRRLVLVATTPGVGQMQGDLKALLNIMTPLRYMSRHAYARTIGSLVGGRARHDGNWIAEQGRVRLQHAPSWRGYLGQLASIATWSGLPLHAKIEAPVLVVTGDDDPLTPVVNAMLLTHMLPNARLLVCHDEGHLIVMDQESEAHPAIREFLTAPRLSRTKVWREASTVSAEELEIALFAAPFQLPPLSIFNQRARRRWLTSAASAPTKTSAHAADDEREPARTRAAG